MNKISMYALVALAAVTGAGCFGAQESEVMTEPESTEAISETPNPCNARLVVSEVSSQKTTMRAFPGILPEHETNKNVRLKTNKGDIVIELLPKEGPCAASNFAYLVGEKFYDGLTFHRYEPGFVIQGGDPLGDGSGHPGYKFEDDQVNLSYDRGIVAMANSGPNTNGSQFFIMLDLVPLPPSYSIFGRVTEGMDVVDQLRADDVMTEVTLEDRPEPDQMNDATTSTTQTATGTEE